MYNIKSTIASNCTDVASLHSAMFVIELVNHEKISNFERRDGTLLEQFSFNLQLVCLKPLAIVDPSEWTFVKPSSGPFSAFLFGTLFVVCLFSSMCYLKEYRSLVYRNTTSTVTAQTEIVPHFRGLYKCQRLLLMGLYIVLFQVFLVNNFRTKLVTELLEPERDLRMYGTENHSVNYNIQLLPSRVSSDRLKIEVFWAFVQILPICYSQPDRIQDGLRIPLARSLGPLIAYSPNEGSAGGDILRPSMLLRDANEHGLISVTQTYKHTSTTHMKVENFLTKTQAEKAHREPNSRWLPQKHWKASIEVFKSVMAQKHVVLFRALKKFS